MGLQEKLNELKKQSVKRIPEESLVVMGRSTDDLRNSGILDNVLKTGDKAPGFSLPDTVGTLFNSEKLLDKGPLVVCFYRGVW